MYKVRWSNKAIKEAAIAERAGFKTRIADIITTVEQNPYKPTQKFEKLKGDLKDMYSRRVDKHNRAVYDIRPNTDNLKDPGGKLYEGIVNILRVWGHY